MFQNMMTTTFVQNGCSKEDNGETTLKCWVKKWLTIKGTSK